MRLTSVQFHNYRGLTDYRLGVDDFNVLVGPNNSGKSTLVRPTKRLTPLGVAKG